MREELPAYVVLSDPGGLPADGTKNWTAGFLPAIYQGTPFRPSGSPVLDLETPHDVVPEARRRQLEFLRSLNADHLGRHPENSELEARITNYELAARMQTSVPEALDVSPGIEGDAGALRPGPTGHAPSTASAAWWRGGWSSAACGSCKSS